AADGAAARAPDRRVREPRPGLAVLAEIAAVAAVEVACTARHELASLPAQRRVARRPADRRTAGRERWRVIIPVGAGAASAAARGAAPAAASAARDDAVILDLDRDGREDRVAAV